MSLELESGASVLSCYEIVKLILFLLPFNLGNLSFVQFSRVGAFFFSLVVGVQSLSHVQLFVTPWTAAHQTSLPFTISWSLLKLMSIELMMLSSHLIPCCPLLLPSIFPSIFQGLFQ